MTYKIWMRILGIVVLSTGWLASPSLHADTKTSSGYSIEDFKLGTTGELVDVCSIETGHPDHAVAISFCYGFFEGATHYDNAIAQAEWYRDIVCIPPNVTRKQAVATFIDSINANPQHQSDAPIDAIFRALVAKWPCAE